MADIFISYSREDREAVEKLAVVLEAAGLTCWWDRQLAAGAKYRERTEIELNAAKAVLVVWTKHSIGSHWVADEATAAVEAGKLAPISLDGALAPLGFRQFQVIDFTGWKGGADGPVQELVAALAAFAQQAEIRNAPTKRGSSSGAIQRMRWPPVSAALVVVSAAAVLLLVGGAAAWWINLNSKQVNAYPVTTLAVLPFDPLDDDPAIVRMASVLPRDMADLFSRGGISVTEPARSMAYSGDAKARAAAELGADLLLDGTVKRDGAQAHVSVRLTHARRGVILWSTDLKADPDDPYVDDRLSALAARMIYWPAPLGILNSDRPNAVEEVRAFLRILQASYNDDHIGAREAAVKLALDAPDLLWARTATAIESMAILPLLRPEERPEALAFARKEAEAALRLGPRDGSAYHAASLVVAPGKWAERISITRRGMEIDPQYTRLESNLAGRLLATGATKDAVSAAKRARAGEPLSPVRAPFLAGMLMANGDIAEMDRVLDAHEQVWPNDAATVSLRLRVAQWRGDLDEAAAILARQAPPGSPEAASIEVAVESALIRARRSGKDDDIEEVGRLCSRVVDEALKHPPASACTFAGGVLDRPDMSIAAAEFLLPRIYNSPAGEDAWLLLSEPDVAAHANELFMPWMAPVRADPEIIDVFDRLGLLAYWKETGNWPDFCETEIAAQRVCSKMKSNE